MVAEVQVPGSGFAGVVGKQKLFTLFQGLAQYTEQPDLVCDVEEDIAAVDRLEFIGLGQQQTILVLQTDPGSFDSGYSTAE